MPRHWYGVPERLDGCAKLRQNLRDRILLGECRIKQLSKRTNKWVVIGMDEDFWQTRWRQNQIGFHEGRANSLLLRFFDRLGLRADDRVLVPLCGKSFDLDWLIGQNFHVVGVEFNKEAVEEVFARLNLVPDVEVFGSLLRYRAKAIDIFVGDFFELTGSVFGTVNAVYDRAALVALPTAMRERYARHLAYLTISAPQLLITFDYDQTHMEGPPFSVSEAEVQKHYGAQYAVEQLASNVISGPLSQRCKGDENTWFLAAR
jgi:thiopurine S-methyltransferase